MALLWRRQRKTGKSGIVDIAWPAGVGVLATFFCLATSEGWLPRRILISVLAMIWAIRLARHIQQRLTKETDDSRYLELRNKWGQRYQKRLLLFYQFQAFGVLLFALPMWLAARNPEPFGLADWFGIGIWLIALVGETTADRQLEVFKSNPANRAEVCQNGLWRYSRHPNYFFEWLHWWAYVCFAANAPLGWLAVLGPVAMFYFVVFVTGIPPAEASSLKRRGNAYRRYQQTTNKFFPGPRRSVLDNLDGHASWSKQKNPPWN